MLSYLMFPTIPTITNHTNTNIKEYTYDNYRITYFIDCGALFYRLLAYNQ